MISFLVPRQPALLRLRLSALGLMAVALASLTNAVLQGQTTNYTIYYPDGRRTITVRSSGSTDLVALDQLAPVFGLTFTEDRVAGGLVIGTRGQRIIAVPGQSFIQVGGKVVGLDGQLQRERNTWTAPIDFLSKALGPAVGERVELRKASRLILVGNVRVPQVGGKVEKTSAGARIVLNVQPMAPHKVTRDGNKLTVRFEATALDMLPITGFINDFASSAKIDGLSVIFDLGNLAATFKAEDDRDAVTIELLPPAPVAPPPPPPALPGATPRPAVPAPELPRFDLSTGGIRTIVIDPGHGGEDAGVKSAGGTEEKALTLLFARRLRASLEARMGVRVLLTRDNDDNVPIDRRTSFANNNKADLFLSLHANSSVRPTVRGAQMYTLDLSSYPQQTGLVEARRRTVPVLGGGTRTLDPMPWDLAQLPFAGEAATLAGILVQQFSERSVPLNGKPAVTAPLRVLVGANMPAVLIELGFLSNADDEKALTSADSQGAIIDSIVAAISEVRRGIPAAEPRGGGQ
jgi:N-acetylmuramoyl-L-alanine amidase